MATVLDDKRARRPAEAPAARDRTLVRRSAPQRRAATVEGRTTPVGPITLSVMRAMIAAADALRNYSATQAVPAFALAQLDDAGPELARHVRRYQAATRRFIADWLRDMRQTAWRVEGCSGRILDTLSVSSGTAGAVRGAAGPRRP